MLTYGFLKKKPSFVSPSTIKSVTLIGVDFFFTKKSTPLPNAVRVHSLNLRFLINEFKVTICKCNTREKKKDLVLLEQNKVQSNPYMGVFSPILFV